MQQKTRAVRPIII